MDDLFGPSGPFHGIDPKAVNEFTQFMLLVCLYDDSDKSRVVVLTPENGEGEGPPFSSYMTACEYLLYKTALKSPAGFEKALELLARGAMAWRDKELPGFDPNLVPEG